MMFAQHISKDMNAVAETNPRPILEIKRDIKVIKKDISIIKQLLVELKDIIKIDKPDEIDCLLKTGLDELEKIEPVSQGWFW